MTIGRFRRRISVALNAIQTIDNEGSHRTEIRRLKRAYIDQYSEKPVCGKCLDSLLTASVPVLSSLSDYSSHSLSSIIFKR